MLELGLAAAKKEKRGRRDCEAGESPELELSNRYVISLEICWDLLPENAGIYYSSV